MSMQFFPERVVGDVGIPSDRAGVSQRDFFPLGEFVRVGEVEQLIILRFSESLAVQPGRSAARLNIRTRWISKRKPGKAL